MSQSFLPWTDISLWSCSQSSSSIESTVHETRLLTQVQSVSLELLNKEVPAIRQQNERIATDVHDGTHEVQQLRQDIGILHKQGFEEMEAIDRLCKNVKGLGPNIETMIATRLEQYGNQWSRAIRQCAYQLAQQETTQKLKEIVCIAVASSVCAHGQQEEKIESLQIGLISQPAMMRSVIEASKTLNKPFDVDSPHSERTTSSQHGRKRGQEKCTCRASLVQHKSTSSGYVLWSYSWLRMSMGLQSSSHDASCPLSQLTQKIDVATISLKHCGIFLAGAIKASLTIKRGCGGLSISPNLECARVVPADSPAFQLVDWNAAYAEQQLNCIEDFANYFETGIRELERLLREGRASVYDVNIDGQTLLHVRVDKDYFRDSAGHSCAQQVASTSRTYWKGSEDEAFEITLDRLSTSFCRKLNAFDVPLNWTDDNGRQEFLGE